VLVNIPSSCAFFWVIPRRLNFICRRFESLSVPSSYLTLPMKTEQSIPKRLHIKFRCRGITQKKAHDIQNTAKVWNQEKYTVFPSNTNIRLLYYSYIFRSMYRAIIGLWGTFGKGMYVYKVYTSAARSHTFSEFVCIMLCHLVASADKWNYFQKHLLWIVCAVFTVVFWYFWIQNWVQDVLALRHVLFFYYSVLFKFIMPMVISYWVCKLFLWAR